MAKTPDTVEATADKPTSLSAWKKAATHHPLLPSGARVGLRIPDLAAMIEAGQVPQHLLKAALGMARSVADSDGGPKVPTTEELTENAAQDREFTDLMALAAVTDPKLTEADLDPQTGIPIEDKQFIVALATRQRDLDAEGEHIAGLTKSDKFRRFRGLDDRDEDVGGL